MYILLDGVRNFGADDVVKGEREVAAEEADVHADVEGIDGKTILQSS